MKNLSKSTILKRICFYILSFTWGAIMSVIGVLVIAAIALFSKGKRIKTYHGRIYGVVGQHWGGLELGCFFITDESECDITLAHECGHGLQNAVLGPLFIFLVFIPSAIRYWYRELKYNRHGITPPTKYDDIWFEGQATGLGLLYVKGDRI